MSLAQPQSKAPDGRISPGLTLSSLPTNNPFRKTTTSPMPSPPIYQEVERRNAATADKRSRNPFLDQTEDSSLIDLGTHTTSPTRMQHGRMSPTKADGNTTDLFSGLSLLDKPSANAENAKPSSSGIHPFQRPDRSQTDPRARNGPRVPHGQSHSLDIFADPSDVRERRHRQQSDPRLDRDGKPLSPEDERRRKERRLRERDQRHRQRDSEGKSRGSRPPGSSSKSNRKPGHLDVIDKLDVTSIYGTGLFHHDGPFDACNPHRNRKESARAPMQAFPKDSANNTIGGSGPVNKYIDIDQFHGHTRDGFTDFNSTPITRTTTNGSETNGSSIPLNQYPRGIPPSSDRPVSAFNPAVKIEPVHGEESIGLGTSTFLDGTPAPRVAIQRRESESEDRMGTGPGGLGRKRSLAQKIRGISNSTRNNPRGVNSPEPLYERVGMNSPTRLPPSDVQSAGGLSRVASGGKPGDSNPFFNDYDDAYEKKGAKIAENEVGASGGASVSGPRGPLVRAATTNSVGVVGTSSSSAGGGAGMLASGNDAPGAEGKSSGGFLNRVKSLKGGRRTRPMRGE
ncbi:hypothetical protein MMC25_000727 [Agyrium rufum]|nr:hypothetical protein [Agyrium rufum]